MPFETRPIAVKAAIVIFFVIAAINLYKGLSPYVCSKRAIVGSIIMFFITAYTIKAVNAILINSVSSSKDKDNYDRVNNAI